MSTARDLLISALKLIGAKAVGESATADEMASGLVALNRMLSSWSTEQLIIFSKVRETFPLVVGQQAYTMGVSGNFNTARPLRVESAGLVMTGTTSYELPLDLITADEWALVGIKNMRSTMPSKLYVDQSNPLATLNFWPVPDGAASVALYSTKPLTAVASASTTIDFPPGYEEALLYNLAVRLSPEYSIPPQPDILGMAQELKGNIKQLNIKPQYLFCDAGVLPKSCGFNILTGDYN